MNIYLDIDGVLLTKEGEPANHLEDFIKKAVANHNCYWLTTHCKGDAKSAREQFNGKVPEEIFELMKKIKPTDWNTFKTEAIDFNEDFFWLDDCVLETEKDLLKEKGKPEGLIKIDLAQDPNQLLEIIREL